MRPRAVAYGAAVLLCLWVSAAAEAQLSPLFNPETMLPADQVRRGMQATSRTVFQGTQIEEFRLEILGVVEKFNSGEPLILARVLDGPVIVRQSGIAGGMSGSPVYVGGKIIGAIAYSWPFLREPIAGITTVNSMLRSWERQPRPEQAAGRPHPDTGVELASRWITRAEVDPQAQEAFADTQTMLLRPVAPLVFCSGFSPRTLQGLETFLGKWGIKPMAGPGTMRDPVPVDLEPGASVGVQLVAGDFDISAVGTVTYVEGNRLLAFGHPMMKLGQTDFPLTTAWVHDILPSLHDSNKLASAMERKGALRQDTAWSVGGELGALPDMVPVQIEIRDRSVGLQHTYDLEIAQNEALTPFLLMFSTVSALEAGFDAGAYGMADTSFVLEGTKGARIQRSNRNYFEGAPLWAVAGEMMEGISILKYNVWEPQDVKSLKLTATLDASDDTALIERAYVEQPIGKAGQPLNVRVVIRPWGKPPVEEVLTLDLPPDMPATTLDLVIGGGMYAMELRWAAGVLMPQFNSLGGVLRVLEGLERNNELIAVAPSHREGMAMGDSLLPDLPASVSTWLQAGQRPVMSSGFSPLQAKRETPYVLLGYQFLSVPVESRTGARPQVTTRPEEGTPAEEDRETALGKERDGEEPEARPGETSVRLPDFPSRSLWWASSALRPEVASRMKPPALSRQGPPAPPGPPGPSGSGRDRTASLARATTATRAVGNSDDQNDIEEEEEAEEPDGEGQVLRQPSTWTQNTQSDFAGGKTHGVGISSEGVLFPIAPWKQAANLPDHMTRAATCTPDGTLYVGTTDPARVLRLQGGRMEQVYEAEELAVSALASRSDGAVIAACSPGGRLVEISPEGEARELATVPASYIWDLLVTASGELYAATGPGGGVYRIDADGTVSLHARVPERHVLCLAERGAALLAGTARRGGIFLLEGPEQVRVLLGLADDDVTSLAVDKQGGIYAGTLPGGELYYLNAQGQARNLWEYERGAIYGLLATREGVYVATAPYGQVFLIPDPDTQATVFTELSSGFLTRLVANAAGQAYVLGTGPGGVWGANLSAPREGVFDSSVLDTERASQWGTASWTADAPEGASVAVQVRSGNTMDPDDGTWTSWSPVESSGAPVRLSSARHLQYRVTLKGADGTWPRLHRMAISYLPANRRPTVSFDDPETGAPVRGTVSVSWSANDEDDDALTSVLFYRPRGERDWIKLSDPTEDTSYEWDTAALVLGHYELRVLVSDRRANPTGWLEKEEFVRDLLVDNEAPTLVLRLAEAGEAPAPAVVGSAADRGSGIVSVAWKVKKSNGALADVSAEEPEGADGVDGEEPDNGEDAETEGENGANGENHKHGDLWTAAVPSRALFTAGLVSFSIPAEQIPDDATVLIVRVIDAAGNSTDQEIRIRPEPADTGNGLEFEEGMYEEAVGWSRTSLSLALALRPGLPGRVLAAPRLR